MNDTCTQAHAKCRTPKCLKCSQATRIEQRESLCWKTNLRHFNTQCTCIRHQANHIYTHNVVTFNRQKKLASGSFRDWVISLYPIFRTRSVAIVPCERPQVVPLKVLQHFIPHTKCGILHMPKDTLIVRSPLSNHLRTLVTVFNVVISTTTASSSQASTVARTRPSQFQAARVTIISCLRRTARKRVHAGIVVSGDTPSFEQGDQFKLSQWSIYWNAMNRKQHIWSLCKTVLRNTICNKDWSRIRYMQVTCFVK